MAEASLEEPTNTRQTVPEAPLLRVTLSSRECPGMEQLSSGTASTGSLLSIQTSVHAASHGEAFLEHTKSQESSWEPRWADNGTLQLPPRPQVPVGTMSAVKGAVGMAASCARLWGCATPLAPRTLCPMEWGPWGRAGGSIPPHYGVGLSTGSPGC